jgi:type 1 fimbria pilin
MKNNMIAIIAVVALMVGAGGFFAGTKYQQGRRGQFAGQFSGQQGDHTNQFRQGSGLGLWPVNGEIISQDDKSITVKLQDGSSKIILLTDTTAINKSAEGSKADLKTGERVMVIGKVNSDGSVTADSISLNPMLRGISGTPSAR